MVFIDIYANPHRFEKLARCLIPYLMGAGLCLLALGIYIGLWASPPDYQQKETVRIMYIHVPAAWLSMGIFFAMGISACFFLVRRHHLAHILAQSMAPLGAVLALICLITGALWGRPTWGTYWIWDARLTSMLILFFLYMAYIIISKTIEDHHLNAKVTSIFALVGCIDLPIIKFSVQWWHSLHQGPSVLRAGGSTIHTDMMTPLLITALGLLFCVSALTLVGGITHLLHMRLRRHYQRQVRHG